MNEQVGPHSFSRADKMDQQKAGAVHNPIQSRTDENMIIHVWSQWNERAARFAQQVENSGATLFQSALWLETWYETFTPSSDIEAVIVGVASAQSGELLMLLPLCKRTENGLSTICFPDFGLADYNAALLHRDFAPGNVEMTRLMKKIARALPKADLLKLEKIPGLISKRPNPLVHMNGVYESSLCHFGVEIKESWDDYWLSRKRNFRKDQRRRWRVLEKKGEVSFLWCRDSDQIQPLFETLLDQQRARLQRLDLHCLLDDLSLRNFYENIIVKGCKNGPVIFTALLVDGEPVATLCGFGNGSQYAMTLSGYETGEWSNCSPGRLLTERTMQILHENGYSYFDFTIGDEPYKKYFAVEQGPLFEYFRPLSLKALPRYSWMKLKASQRKSELAHTVKNLFSK